MGIALSIVYTQLILLPILGALWLGIRKERRQYERLANEVLAHSWKKTPYRKN